MAAAVSEKVEIRFVLSVGKQKITWEFGSGAENI